MLDFSTPKPGTETRINQVKLRIEQVLACMPSDERLADLLQMLYRSHLREQASFLPARLRLQQTSNRTTKFSRYAWRVLSRRAST
jgi:hypothetical protein